MRAAFTAILRVARLLGTVPSDRMSKSAPNLEKKTRIWKGAYTTFLPISSLAGQTLQLIPGVEFAARATELTLPPSLALPRRPGVLRRRRSRRISPNGAGFRRSTPLCRSLAPLGLSRLLYDFALRFAAPRAIESRPVGAVCLGPGAKMDPASTVPIDVRRSGERIFSVARPAEHQRAGRHSAAKSTRHIAVRLKA